MTSADVPRFVRSVYDMLQNEDQRILSWSLDGSHFQVYDVPRLETEVLRKYYKHSKFSSFQRQLNNFGFHKWTKTRASVATFSHDVLVRCHPSQLAVLARQIKQKMSATPTAFMKTTTSTKRPRSALATMEHAVSMKKHKMSPRDVSAVDDMVFDLSDVCFSAILEPLWLLEQSSEDSDCSQDDPLLGALDAVDLATLDWDAVASSAEPDADCGDSIIDVDATFDFDCAAPCEMLGEDDVAAILDDMESASTLSDCELDALVGYDSDIDVNVLLFI
ncbi:Heat shock transcription factor [Phytophthora megakarya]|uniref:Heat shock transcription factor n=1 Tax=Phytophthora megakarya TaxID=4795 RepID=A0A225WSM5_9STRA|nr:Heat shock transcription factor [Phytophthora megakarya]